MENSGLVAQGGEDPSAAAIELLRQAMARRVCVTATYNRAAMTLAPHTVFTKHGDPFLRAVTVDQDGRKPGRPKLGLFKLSGLSGIALTRKLFSPFPGFRADDPDYAETAICTL